MPDDLLWHALHDHYDEALTRRFYSELIIPNFPISDELEDISVWVEELTRETPAEDATFYLLVATNTNNNTKTNTDTILGGVVFEYYLHSCCGLISYIVVHPTARSQGLGRQLLHKAVSILHSAAQSRGSPQCRGIFVETNVEGLRDGVMEAGRRHALLRRWGFAHVQFPYVQPALSARQLPCRDLLLLKLVEEEEEEGVDADVVLAFMRDFWAAMYEEWAFAALPVFKGMIRFGEEIRDRAGAARKQFFLLNKELPWVQESLPKGGISVVVVGAGIAGLSAARGLARYGFDVQVLEASQRVGGRLWTGEVDEIEYGASFVHGEESSIAQLAQRQGWGLEETFDVEEGSKAAWVSQGEVVELEDIPEAEELEAVYEALKKPQISNDLSLLEFLKQRNSSERCIKMAQALWATTEAADLCEVGAKAYVDQSERWTDGSKNFRLSGGYQVLLEHCLAGDTYDIKLGKFVSTIQLLDSEETVSERSKAILVKCEDGSSFNCDFVVCTVPLSVLKAQRIAFAPELSAKKSKSIRELGFGSASKLVLVLKDRVEFVTKATGERMDILLWVDDDCVATQVWTKSLQDGRQLIIGFVTGAKARETHSVSEEELLEQFCEQLDVVLKSKGTILASKDSFKVIHWEDITGELKYRVAFSVVNLSAGGL